MTQEEKILRDKILYFMKHESEYTNTHRLSIANEIIDIISDSGLELKRKNWYDEQGSNQRMNVIGQNGNEGIHYDK